MSFEIMALIGYARVSTQDQHLHLRHNALNTAGCIKIFTDTASGTKAERRGLEEALNFLREGDILVVWQLDRLGRSLKDLIERLTELHARNIGFKSLTENINTITSGGKLIFHIFGALAEFERDIIRERTNAGLNAARTRGKKGGRPKSPISEERKLQLAKKMYEDKTMPRLRKSIRVYTFPARHFISMCAPTPRRSNRDFQDSLVSQQLIHCIKPE
jgi:DNA invertase Pin-like site-specific DNA recombinase